MSDKKPDKDAVEAAIDRELRNLIEKHSLAIESLTKEQLAEAMKQAIKSGDFVRYILQGTGAQNISYIPFREVESLRYKLRQCEEKLAELTEALKEIGEKK